MKRVTRLVCGNRVPRTYRVCVEVPRTAYRVRLLKPKIIYMKLKDLFVELTRWVRGSSLDLSTRDGVRGTRYAVPIFEPFIFRTTTKEKSDETAIMESLERAKTATKLSQESEVRERQQNDEH